MKGFTIEIPGLDKLLNDVSKEGQELARKVDEELVAGAYDIERSAKRAVRKDLGALASSISAGRVQFLQMEVVAQKHYAPYVEFGTGALVDVPAGLEDYAIQFKGKGVRKVNLPARPFLFRSAYAYMPEIIKRIKEVLKF